MIDVLLGNIFLWKFILKDTGFISDFIVIQPHTKKKKPKKHKHADSFQTYEKLVIIRNLLFSDSQKILFLSLH